MDWTDWLAVLVPVALVLLAGQLHRAASRLRERGT